MRPGRTAVSWRGATEAGIPLRTWRLGLRASGRSPADIGYQHGYLLAPEIETGFKAVQQMTSIAPNETGIFIAQPLTRFCVRRSKTSTDREILKLVCCNTNLLCGPSIMRPAP